MQLYIDFLLRISKDLPIRKKALIFYRKVETSIYGQREIVFWQRLPFIIIF
ncbi:hypothetical protein BBOH_1663 [Bifidobacterium bohemicum DSM 22767]|uniref:Uncharacterized protein n=1 Tax=Bifidobacterium bohemicum DSM 22767 TaxID=1437606 RepID=A0A086ZFK0_9BIFI|nr:hypothetical protein BBOH_1663 [Bifidobacterium bohemicum DSM 22767]